MEGWRLVRVVVETTQSVWTGNGGVGGAVLAGQIGLWLYYESWQVSYRNSLHCW